MKIRVRCLRCIAYLVACAVFPGSMAVFAQEQGVQVIELTAKKYEFTGGPVHVKAGTKVQLKITATDHDHGFKIGAIGEDKNGKPGLIFTNAQDCVQLKKGETTTIEFVAQAPGTYLFKCCHTCGLGHGGMKSQIIVE